LEPEIVTFVPTYPLVGLRLKVVGLTVKVVAATIVVLVETSSEPVDEPEGISSEVPPGIAPDLVDVKE